MASNLVAQRRHLQRLIPTLHRRTWRYPQYSYLELQGCELHSQTRLMNMPRTGVAPFPLKSSSGICFYLHYHHQSFRKASSHGARGNCAHFHSIGSPLTNARVAKRKTATLTSTVAILNAIFSRAMATGSGWARYGLILVYSLPAVQVMWAGLLVTVKRYLTDLLTDLYSSL